MFPPPGLPYASIGAFIDSLTPKQQVFLAAWNEYRETRLQQALDHASRGMGVVSDLLSDATLLRLGRADT